MVSSKKILPTAVPLPPATMLCPPSAPRRVYADTYHRSYASESIVIAACAALPVTHSHIFSGHKPLSPTHVDFGEENHWVDEDDDIPEFASNAVEPYEYELIISSHRLADFY